MSPDPSSHSPAARAEAQAMALGFAHDGERRAFERFREELTPQGWVIAHNLISQTRSSAPHAEPKSPRSQRCVQRGFFVPPPSTLRPWHRR